MKSHSNVHEAYLSTLKDVWFNPEHKSAPRGLAIRECLDYSFRITNPVAEPIVTNDLERNKTIAEYTAKEVALYDSCSNKVEDFAKASKFWNQIANPDGTINSAYGYLIWKNRSCGNAYYQFSGNGGPTLIPAEFNIGMHTPWEWAKQSLIKDKDTRQAILRFSLPEHQWEGVKDFTCTMYGNFLIRDDKLHFSVFMRSNDMVKGFTYDVPWFISLMDRMIEELKPTYPDLTKGNYTHTANSIHVYEKDEQIVLKMLG